MKHSNENFEKVTVDMNKMTNSSRYYYSLLFLIQESFIILFWVGVWSLFSLTDAVTNVAACVTISIFGAVGIFFVRLGQRKTMLLPVVTENNNRKVAKVTLNLRNTRNMTRV